MSDPILRFYHALPSPARSLVATARGLVLRRQRFGPESERIVEEALDRDRWTPERLRSWQQERLAHVLWRASRDVPYYRDQWAERRRRGDAASPELLENWPLLEKDAVRGSPRAFVADDRSAGRMIHIHTSGTSGKPVSIFQTRDTVRTWYALHEARTRRWYGVSSRSDRYAVFGGQLVTPVAQRRPPFWVWNAALGQLYMSSYHLAPDLTPAYVEALHRYRIRYVEGYTSSLYALAEEASRLGPTGLHMEVALTYAEPVATHQRAAIQAAFGGPVRETYGMAEAVAAASECEAGELHLWPEAGLVEIVEAGTSVPRGASGELVCTGLVNADMPLIRYKVGDRGSLERDGLCSCGRTLPRMSRLEGRSDEVLYTADGRRIGRLDPVFKADLPIREAQIVQEAFDRVRVRYVPAPGFRPDTTRSIAERLRERMGAVNVEFEEVSEIPRTANGKFRAVISLIGAQRTPAGDTDPVSPGSR